MSSMRKTLQASIVPILSLKKLRLRMFEATFRESHGWLHRVAWLASEAVAMETELSMFQGSSQHQ